MPRLSFDNWAWNVEKARTTITNFGLNFQPKGPRGWFLYLQEAQDPLYMKVKSDPIRRPNLAQNLASAKNHEERSWPPQIVTQPLGSQSQIFGRQKTVQKEAASSEHPPPIIVKNLKIALMWQKSHFMLWTWIRVNLGGVVNPTQWRNVKNDKCHIF